MSGSWETGVTGAALAGLCIMPSAVANVLPHVTAIWVDGAVNSGEATTAIFQGVSVVAMAAMPFAVRNVREVSLKAACWLLAALLFVLNLLNALDAASSARETATGPNRGAIAKAAGLKSRLAGLRNSRAQVPQFTPTSVAQAAAAQAAVTAAETARDLECTKVGPNCRARVREAAAAAQALSGVLAQRALSERADGLDSEIAAIEKALLELGPVPKHIDATAAKAARLLGAFISIGADGEQQIAEWRPIAFAIGIELLALIGPIGMVAAVRENGGERTPAPVPAPAPCTEPAPAPAKPRKQRKKAVRQAPFGSVADWLSARTVPADSSVRAGVAYAAYCSWCEESKHSPISLTAFGKTMKGDLGIAYAEKSKRGFYEGIALTGAKLKIAASA